MYPEIIVSKALQLHNMNRIVVLNNYTIWFMAALYLGGFFPDHSSALHTGRSIVDIVITVVLSFVGLLISIALNIHYFRFSVAMLRNNNVTVCIINNNVNIHVLAHELPSILAISQAHSALTIVSRFHPLPFFVPFLSNKWNCSLF